MVELLALREKTDNFGHKKPITSQQVGHKAKLCNGEALCGTARGVGVGGIGCGPHSNSRRRCRWQRASTSRSRHAARTHVRPLALSLLTSTLHAWTRRVCGRSSSEHPDGPRGREQNLLAPDAAGRRRGPVEEGGDAVDGPYPCRYL